MPKNIGGLGFYKFYRILIILGTYRFGGETKTVLCYIMTMYNITKISSILIFLLQMSSLIANSSDMDPQVKEFALEEFNTYIERNWTLKDKQTFNRYPYEVKIELAMQAQINAFSGKLSSLVEKLNKTHLEQQTFNHYNTSGDGNCLLHSVPSLNSKVKPHDEHKDIQQFHNSDAKQMRKDLILFNKLMSPDLAKLNIILPEIKIEDDSIDNNYGQIIAILSQKPLKMWRYTNQKNESQGYDFMASFDQNNSLLEQFKHKLETKKGLKRYHDILNRFKVENSAQNIHILYHSNHFSRMKINYSIPKN